jgi:allantoicase
LRGYALIELVGSIPGRTMKDFTQLADLAAERLGGAVLEANDDFFAPKENLLKEAKPIFIEGKFTDRGKWMDGWETRRRRTPGYDWCIIRLGLPGILHGVVVDTSFFKGNYPEHFSLEACDLGGQPPYKNEAKRLNDSRMRWTEVVPQTALKGDSQNLFPIANEIRFTHVRLKIYPDGGVARLRVHGEAVPDAKEISRGEIDLVAVGNGGSVVASSDQFFGEPRNLLMPYHAENMGDGWETRRRRGAGHDWVILKLGVPGIIRKIVVDTAHFRGNFPDSCSMEACHAAASGLDTFLAAPHVWRELLPQTKLSANHRHVFAKLKDAGPTTHVRFNIYPDGGVSRLRLFGRAVRDERQCAGLRYFNQLSLAEARKALLDCCGSQEWVKQMLQRTPFPDLAHVLDTADKTWAMLGPTDWEEAFRHHPPIGAKRGEKGQSATAKRWSEGEQATAQKAAPHVLAALAKMNQEYQKKFGHVFLICATGKTSEEILASLKERLASDPDAELRIAAEEQRKITRIRLENLFTS